MSKALKGIGVGVLGGLFCLLLTGCQGTATTETGAAEPVVVDPLNPPTGHVLRVWPSSDCTIDIGTEVGVGQGDWLCIMRNGKEVQYLEVRDAQANISYCRVAVRENPARPRVDDFVILEPKNFRDVHNTPAQ